jgi:phospholipid/cholesterol/gamma-HCH transport system substrate-binding protein
VRNPFRGRFQRSFLERNQRLIGAIGIAALLAGSLFALLLTGGVFARTYHVTGYFTDAAGILPGDKVTVAGLPAGTVKGLRIEKSSVAIDLAVNRGVQLPADSGAAVVIQTLLGKRSVSVIAGQSKEHLKDGSVIPLDRTTTPVDITQLNDISVRLLNGSDAQALNTLMDEVTKVTTGKQQQVEQLISGLADLTAAVDSRREQLARLLDSLRTLSTVLGDKNDTIVSLIDNLNPVLANLAQRQQQIQTLLVATDSASHQTADLVVRNRKVLDGALGSLHQVFGVIDKHQVDLAAAISYLEDAVQGYQSVGYSGGNCGEVDSQSCAQGSPNDWANIFVQSLGPAGVDALLGKCGAVDQLIDQILGTDCNSAQAGLPLLTKGLGGNLPGLSGGLPLPLPSLPPLPGSGHPPVPTPSLPFPTPPLPLPSLGPGEAQNGTADPGYAMPQTLADLVFFALDGWEGPR